MSSTGPTLYDTFCAASGKRATADIRATAPIEQIATLLSIGRDWRPDLERQRTITALLLSPRFKSAHVVVGQKPASPPPPLLTVIRAGQSTLQSRSNAAQRAERERREQASRPLIDVLGLPLSALAEPRSLLIEAGASEEALTFLVGAVKQAKESEAQAAPVTDADGGESFNRAEPDEVMRKDLARLIGDRFKKPDGKHVRLDTILKDPHIKSSCSVPGRHSYWSLSRLRADVNQRGLVRDDTPGRGHGGGVADISRHLYGVPAGGRNLG